jgi:hypothetical protein
MFLKQELEFLALAKPDTWSTLDEAMTVVSEGFGSYFFNHDRCGRAGYDYARIDIAQCDVAQRERDVKSRLDQIGWQMFTIFLLDRTRYKRMGTGDIDKAECNVYGIVPFGDIKVAPWPTFVYHATEIVTAEVIKTEGLKPSKRTDYPDAEGKLHVCQSFEGDEKSATHWVNLLSQNRGLSRSDYTILRVKLESVHARMYHDLHGLCGSGIVVDQFSVIPPNTITSEFRLVEDSWVERSA